MQTSLMHLSPLHLTLIDGSLIENRNEVHRGMTMGTLPELAASMRTISDRTKPIYRHRILFAIWLDYLTEDPNRRRSAVSGIRNCENYAVTTPSFRHDRAVPPRVK